MPRGRERQITLVEPPGVPSDPSGLVPSSETSVAWSLNQGSQTVVVGFNDCSFGNLGWAWTDDVDSAPAERNWTYCNSGSPGVPPSVPTCGAPVPFLPGMLRFRGDPYLAAANDGTGTVVYTALADAGNLGGEWVVASLSNDGGRTFTRVVRVNDDGCSGGVQDQQAAAFDTTTSPPTLWVAWRHPNVVSVPGNYGACVRGGTVDPVTMDINWLTSRQRRSSTASVVCTSRLGTAAWWLATFSTMCAIQ